MTLNRDQLLKASVRVKAISIEGVGDISIKALSAGSIFNLYSKTEKPTEDTLFELVALSVCDAEGNAILTKEDAALLETKTINTIIAEVFSFNAMNQEAVEQARSKLKNAKPKS